MKLSPNKKSAEKGSRRIVLSGALTVQRAAETQRLLEDALKGSTGMTILFDEVSDVDLSFLQILHAARTTCKDTGQTFAIEGDWPEILDRIVLRAGLTQEMCLADNPAQRDSAEDPQHSKGVSGPGEDGPGSC